MSELLSLLLLVAGVVSLVVSLIVLWWMLRVLQELREINKETTAFNEIAKQQHQEILAALKKA